MKKKILHELLAYNNDLQNMASKIQSETIKTFSDKQGHFDGIQKIYNSYNENDDKVPPETKEVVTTVSEKINYSKESIIKSIDTELIRNETNCSGYCNAKIDIDGKEHELSIIALMDLEKQLIKIRNIYSCIPTLDPTKTWNRDLTVDRDIYVSEKEVKYRTAKDYYSIELAQATKEHKAQVQLMSKDVQVGIYETTYKSGRITPGQKSKLLQRIDNIILEVKKAKSKANQNEVIERNIGNEIFNYINKDII